MRTKFENTSVYNFKNAMVGMRNPLASWAKNDTYETSRITSDSKGYGRVIIEPHVGPNDLDLACRLIKAGSSDRKFMRQIFVSVDITAPAYWWAEFDTFKVNVTRNSSSFMHKGTSRPYEMEDFESISESALEELNKLRNEYLNAKTEEYEKEAFCALRSEVPFGFLYRSTITMNYENIFNMFCQRKNHRLPHWRVDFCKWALTLPYMREFLVAAKIIDEDYEPKK